jgi:hypothetical protein
MDIFSFFTDQFGWKAGGGSFLFSIRNNDNLSPFKSSLKVADSGDAINTLYHYGPTFGGGHDLKIASNAKGPHRPDAIRHATRIFSFQKQIKPSTDKNFTRYADQIAKIA